MENKIEVNPSKSTTFKSTPPKLLKSEPDLVSTTLQIIFNNAVGQTIFPDELKLADISCLFKQNIKIFKRNCRPINILPIVSKVFERLMNTKLSTQFLHIYHGCIVVFARAIMPSMN